MKTVILLIVLGLAVSDKLIFEDNFDTLNMATWQHELTMGGGGNWEFEMYVNNRTNSFVKDGVLHLKPTLSVETLGMDTLLHGDVNIWGGSPADQCTGNAFYGCERNAAASGNVINPIQSARVRTVNSFSFKYGRVEVRAKLPKGDWIWPAIWMLPKYNAYGQWPASGEIDIMESRGNDASYPDGGNDAFGSTLHWGPYYAMNGYLKTHADYKHPKSLGDDFHVYGLQWTADRIFTYLDTPSNVIMDVPITQDFWTKGQFPQSMSNPWEGSSTNAPFDQEFYIVMNVAVGGTQGYFPDGKGNKPWDNGSSQSVNQFWNNKDQWYNTWDKVGENSAMKIDSVKVWSFDSTE